MKTKPTVSTQGLPVATRLFGHNLAAVCWVIYLTEPDNDMSQEKRKI